MPTMRSRYQVTETEALARALDVAAERWPGEPRSRLLLRLVEVGADALDEQRQREVQVHHAAVSASSGAYPEAFSSHHLADLREDWPA